MSAHPPDAWDAFLATERPDIGYKQYRWWAELLESKGRWGSFVVAIREDGGIRGGARVWVREFAPGKCYFHLADAPVLPRDFAGARRIYRATLAAINAHRAKTDMLVSHLRLEPRWTKLPMFVEGARPTRAFKEPRNTLSIDLRLSGEKILAQMKKKGRYNIRLAERKGVTIVEDNSRQGARDFMTLYKATSERQGIRRHSTSTMKTLAGLLLRHECGSLLFAEYEGMRLSAAMLIHAGHWTTYKYGGQGEAHRNVMAPYLLHWEAIRRAKILGHRWYDFYGVAKPGKEDDRLAGISEFKRKFGGTEMGFVPAMDIIYDADAHRAYRKPPK